MGKSHCTGTKERCIPTTENRWHSRYFVWHKYFSTGPCVLVTDKSSWIQKQEKSLLWPHILDYMTSQGYHLGCATHPQHFKDCCKLCLNLCTAWAQILVMWYFTNQLNGSNYTTSFYIWVAEFHVEQKTRIFPLGATDNSASYALSPLACKFCTFGSDNSWVHFSKFGLIVASRNRFNKVNIWSLAQWQSWRQWLISVVDHWLWGTASWEKAQHSFPRDKADHYHKMTF